MMGGNESGGWYIADFPSVPALTGILEMILRNPRLGGMLDDLLGEKMWRLLSRSEIYSDRTNVWHADGLYGAFSLYNNELTATKRLCARHPKQRLCREGGVPSMAFWQKDDQNETHRVVTVGIYLQASKSSVAAK